MAVAEPIVFVVDDDPAVRDSLRLLLKSAGLSTQLYANAQAFLDDFDPRRPGCVVVDVRMPGMNGLELQAALNARNAALPLIVMTGHGDIPMAVQAMKAGAHDFVEKPYDDDHLLSRIEQCLRLDAAARAKDASAQQNVAMLAKLTAREREVMALLVEGKPNKVIAARLDISTRTVEVHRARIMEKLNARSLADIVRLALDPQ